MLWYAWHILKYKWYKQLIAIGLNKPDSVLELSSYSRGQNVIELVVDMIFKQHQCKSFLEVKMEWNLDFCLTG